MSDAVDVVRTVAEAAKLDRPPLVILEPLESLLDDLGIGTGPLEAHAIGDGHSNVTFRLTRGGQHVVLRRPPQPPYPRSAHDVVREARLLQVVREKGLRVPAVLAVHDDPDLLGVPFVLVEFVDGTAISADLPSAFAGAPAGRRIGEELIDALVEIHRLDTSTAPLAALGKPSGYLGRQLRRFAGIWDGVATRDVPDLDVVTRWLRRTCPASAETTLVHGDYRLGNTLFAANPTAHLVAILDWEMATLGDPLADLGYLLATWAEPGDSAHPLRVLSATSLGEGFLPRSALRDRYVEQTGRDLSSIDWYEVLALWKATIFLEASYSRFLSGSTTDPYFEHLGTGVPLLAAEARARTTDPNDQRTHR